VPTRCDANNCNELRGDASRRALHIGRLVDAEAACQRRADGVRFCARYDVVRHGFGDFRQLAADYFESAGARSRRTRRSGTSHARVAFIEKAQIVAHCR
jgi:hypothetical protein